MPLTLALSTAKMWHNHCIYRARPNHWHFVWKTEFQHTIYWVADVSLSGTHTHTHIFFSKFYETNSCHYQSNIGFSINPRRSQYASFWWKTFQIPIGKQNNNFIRIDVKLITLSIYIRKQCHFESMKITHAIRQFEINYLNERYRFGQRHAKVRVIWVF